MNNLVNFNRKCQNTPTGAGDLKKRKIADSCTTSQETNNNSCELSLKNFLSPAFNRDSPKRYKVAANMETENFEEESYPITDTTSEVDETLEVVDVRTVLQMFQQCKEELKISKNTAQAMKSEIKKEIESDLNTALEMQEKRIEKLEEEIRDANRRAKLSEDIIRYNAEVVEDITKRLDSLELANARRMAILTGLSTSNKKETRLQQVTEFLCHELEIFTRLEDTYLIGSKEPRPVVIIFQTLYDKNTAFEKKQKLKDISTKENSYYLNHYLPAAENEKRKRERVISKENAALQKKEEISYSQGTMMIGSIK